MIEEVNEELDDELSEEETAALEDFPEEEVVEEEVVEAEPEKEEETVAVKKDTIEEINEKLNIALQEERGRRRDELSKAQDEIKRMEERFTQFTDKFQKKEEVIPDFEQDTAGNLQYNINKQNERIAELEGASVKSDEERVQQDDLQKLYQSTRGYEDAFTKDHADYQDAVNFANAARDKELQALGVEDPGERSGMILDEAIQAARYALKVGADPANYFYQQAQGRGYKKGNSKDETRTGKEQIEIIKKARTATSLGSRNATKGEITLQKMTHMTDEEFDKVSDDDWKRLWE